MLDVVNAWQCYKLPAQSLRAFYKVLHTPYKTHALAHAWIRKSPPYKQIMLWFVLFSTFAISACGHQPNRVTTTGSVPLQDLRFKYKHFKYVADIEQFGKEDHWQTPEETRLNEKYDCEDIAFLYYFELLDQGHQAQLIYGVLNDGQAHVVVSLNGWVLDGNKLYREERINFRTIYKFTHNSITYPHAPKYFTDYTARIKETEI